MELAYLRHELNQPLLFLTTSLSLCRLRLSRASAFTTRDDALEALAAAEEAAAHLAGVVRLVGAARRDPEREAVDLASVLNDVLRIAGPELRAHCAVDTDFRALSRVWGSTVRLRQVLLNLLANALSAVSPSHVPDPRVSVSTAINGPDRVVVRVVDNGVGIEPGERHRLFEPGFTGHPGTGSGLGLALCRSIIARFGGSLELESPPEGGTVARVELASVQGGEQ